LGGIGSQHLEAAPRGWSRRRFLKTGIAGATAMSAYGLLTWAPRAEGSQFSIDLFITEGDAMMVDGRSVYVRTYSGTKGKVSLPGPLMLVAEGDELTITVTNTLATEHGFAIDGVVDSGPIKSGETRVLKFTAPAAGTYLYQDPVNVPFNRLLGLHGALVTMPADGSNAPYEGGPEFVRQWIWVTGNVDSNWCEHARNGGSITLEEIVPDYFTINGRAGVDAVHDPSITVHGKLHEPALVRIVNAGVATHAMHFHGNHLDVLCHNGKRAPHALRKDTIMMPGGWTKDALLPFEPPPDIWPPLEEWGDEVTLSYPMHCHAEMSQSAAGGLYPNGMLAHWEIEK
jgi:FtsP/CotA-like multicopper oxidase with cupredoxin domain